MILFNNLKRHKLNSVYIFIIFIYAISLPIGMIKILHWENLAFIYINFFYSSMILLSLLFAYKTIKLKRIYFDLLSLFLLMLLFYGTFLGIAYKNNLSDIIIDAGRIFFALTSYLYFYNRTKSIDELKHFLKYLSKILLYVYAVIIPLAYICNLKYGVIAYFSISSQRLLIPMIYYLKKSSLKSFISFLLIAFSGKRGVLLVALIIFIMIFILEMLKRKNINKLIHIFIFISFLLVVCIIISFISPNTFDVVSNRWKSLNLFSEDFNYEIASSGRFDEIRGVFSSMKNDNINFFIGAGNGYSYSFVYKTKSADYIYDNYRNVHVSIINVFMLYGGIATLILYGIILYKLFLIKKHIKRNKLDLSDDYVIVFFILVGFFLYTFFVYELFQEALIWIFLAVLSKTLKLKLSQ